MIKPLSMKLSSNKKIYPIDPSSSYCSRQPFQHSFFLMFCFIFSFLNIYLFGCTGSSLPHLESSIFITACRIFSRGIWTLSCSRWDLVPWPGINPGPPALGTWSFSLRTTREVPLSPFLSVFSIEALLQYCTDQFPCSSHISVLLLWARLQTHKPDGDHLPV